MNTGLSRLCHSALSGFGEKMPPHRLFSFSVCNSSIGGDLVDRYSRMKPAQQCGRVSG